MRNALRKIAALQAKPQPRSRASSAHTSAFVSSRVSSEGDPATAAQSRDASPERLDAFQRNTTQVLAASDTIHTMLPAGNVRKMLILSHPYLSPVLAWPTWLCTMVWSAV